MMFRSVLLASLAAYAVADTTPTIGMFIDNMDPMAMWAASVVDVHASTTTYAIVCTSAPLDPGCSVGAQAVTITEGPSFYAATTTAVWSETSATITETCTVDSTVTSAACTQTVVADGYGEGNAITTSYNLTGTNYNQYQVAITAGAKKLSNSDSQSSSASSSAAVSVVAIGAGFLMGIAAVFVL